MGRAETLFAACAVAVALLAGTACAIASAEPADSPASDSTTSDDEQPSPPPDDANPYIGDNDRTGGEDTTTGGSEGAGEESGDDTAAEEKPSDSAPDDRVSRPANKMPPKLPEAPPADIIPLPDELPPLPLEPPELDAVDVTMLGPGASPSEGNDSPVMKMPVIIAPPGHILGTSITARGTLRPAITAPSRGPGEQPAPRQPTTGLREPPIASAGVNVPQTANRIGVTKEGLPRVRLAATVAGALPGIGGIIVMTAAGVCLGHRQATAANQLRAHGLDRFLA